MCPIAKLSTKHLSTIDYCQFKLDSSLGSSYDYISLLWRYRFSDINSFHKLNEQEDAKLDLEPTFSLKEYVYIHTMILLFSVVFPRLFRLNMDLLFCSSMISQTCNCGILGKWLKIRLAVTSSIRFSHRVLISSYLFSYRLRVPHILFILMVQDTYETVAKKIRIVLHLSHGSC